MSIAEKLTTVAENQQKVYDAGAKSEYDQLWDELQDNGTRRMYANGFCMNSWTKESFKPKYDMKPTNAANMFAYWGTNGRSNEVDPIDLREIGAALDFSECTAITGLFSANGLVSAVGTIDTTSAPSVEQIFYGCSALKTVEKLILKADGSQTTTRAFNTCGSLTNITIEGVIGNAVTFTSSTKLTHDSLMSVIGALKDFVAEGAGTTKTLTLGATNLAKLTDDEKKIATDKGWTLA